MNLNNNYIVQCNCENFEDIKHLVQLFSSVIEVDNKNHIIKTLSLDNIMKQRLAELGVGFWEDSEIASKRYAL